jgi:hypothetical protein
MQRLIFTRDTCKLLSKSVRLVNLPIASHHHIRDEVSEAKANKRAALLLASARCHLCDDHAIHIATPMCSNWLSLHFVSATSRIQVLLRNDSPLLHNDTRSWRLGSFACQQHQHMFVNADSTQNEHLKDHDLSSVVKSDWFKLLYSHTLNSLIVSGSHLMCRRQMFFDTFCSLDRIISQCFVQVSMRRNIRTTRRRC